MRVRSIIAASVALVLSASHVAAATQQDDERLMASITVTLQTRYPEVSILDVRPGPVAGLYEVFTGDAVVYADAAGDHLFVGQLVDTRTKENLTAKRLDVRNSIDFRSLPFDRAIKMVKGNGQRQIAVFSDPDCPYCRELEAQLALLTDVTVYTFLYPLQDVHPEAAAKARAIWCAPDRAAAWAKWMHESTLPEQRAECAGDPIDALQALGRDLRIGATPTLFLASGRRVGGLVSPDKLVELLEAESAPGAAVRVGAADK